MVLRSVKGAERTLILTDIGVIDVPVDEECHDVFRVLLVTNDACSLCERQQISIFQERMRILLAQSLIAQGFIKNLLDVHARTSERRWINFSSGTF